MSMEISLADVNEALLEEIKDLHLRLAQLRAGLKASTQAHDSLLQDRAHLVEEIESLRPSGGKE